MSRVQHRGEPDPLHTAAGQRSVVICQSPRRDKISAYLMFKHVLRCVVQVNETQDWVFENNINYICFSGTKRSIQIDYVSLRLYDLIV